jgi:hypothetical protein
MSTETPQKRLRKQPKRRRIDAATAVNLPQVNLPKTAQKRRRRKTTEPVRFGLVTVKRFLFSSRWISLGLLMAAVFALKDIYQEPRFYLTYIPVEGSTAVSPEEIADASGLAGSHVFAADPALAAKNIGALPGIISSTVTLRWPNQVYIQVAEEAAVAIWSEGGVEYGVTQSGRLFPAVRANPTLVRIESEMKPKAPVASSNVTPAESSNQVAAGSPGSDGGLGRASEPEALATSLAFIPPDILEGAVQLHSLRPNIERLYYQPTGGLSIEDERGWRGYFGTGPHMNQKLAVYESIVADLLARGIYPGYISVSNQEKPYYGIATVPIPGEGEG